MMPSTRTTADPTSRVLIALLAVVLGSCTADATEMRGTVTRVWDGDTVTLTVRGQEHRVRLGAIDAPEHDQPFGRQASEHLTDLVLNKTVRLVTETTDPYGRLVGTLWVQPRDCPRCGQTLDAGLAMLTVGLAWWYRRYADEQSPEARGQYEFAEYEAKAKRVGLWQDANPVAPWDWKQAARNRPDAGDCRIKGNISENGRIYHVPGQQHYDRTRISPSRGERWFCTEEEARAAGWRRARE